MSKKLKRSVSVAAVAVAMLLTLAPAASADTVTVGFICITQNGGAGSCTPLEPQFLLTISVSGGNVTFRIDNLGPLDSSIALVAFDNSVGILNLGGAITIDSHANVSFTQDGSPGNLPGGNTVNFTEAITFSAVPPPSDNGVEPDEWVSFEFVIDVSWLTTACGGGVCATDHDIAHAIAAALQLDGDGNIGDLGIGIHVISLDDGLSQSLIAVPEPASMLLLGTGLLGLGGAIRRRKKA